MDGTVFKDIIDAPPLTLEDGEPNLAEVVGVDDTGDDNTPEMEPEDNGHITDDDADDALDAAGEGHASDDDLQHDENIIARDPDVLHHRTVKRDRVPRAKRPLRGRLHRRRGSQPPTQRQQRESQTDKT